MSIKNYIIDRKVLLLLSPLFIVYQCYTQNINGVFLLGANNQTYYVNFKNNTYELFSLQENPKPGGKSNFVIKEVGTGLYKKSNRDITFNFDDNTQKYQFYSSDSLICSMSTNQSNAGKTFEICLKANVPDYDNSYLIIQGYSKDYPLQVKDGKLTTVLPDSVAIKNIFISVMGLGRRQLPFIKHYNVFRYIYFINDSLPQISYIKNETWNLQIKSQDKNYFKLNSTNYLSKADAKTIGFLKELANANLQIKRLTENWFNE